MKYVIVEVIDGTEIPFIFPEFVRHDFIFGQKLGVKVISAGRFNISCDQDGNMDYLAYGDSISLQVKSRPEDTDIIKHAFEFN